MSNRQPSKADKGMVANILKHLDQTLNPSPCINRTECVLISTMTIITLGTMITAIIYIINETGI